MASTKKKKKSKPVKTRNVHASAPIMRKGGAHVTTGKAKRKREKVELKKELAAPFFVAKKH